MQQLYPWLILAVLILVILISFIFLARALWKDKRMFFESWRKMSSFEKISLEIGLLFYVVIPILKENPSKDSYISKVSIDIFTALASALFVLGVLAFLKYAHEQNNSNKKPNK